MLKAFPMTEAGSCKWNILIRLLVGLVVFLPEGIQKFLFPALLGGGRFAKIGMPYPDLLAQFVGFTEIACGLLIVIGLFARVAAIPLIGIMLVAIASTKIPILLGHDFLIFHAPRLSRYGFWSMQHEARNDFCMLLGSVYLLLTGAGRWSFDHWLKRMKSRQ